MKFESGKVRLKVEPGTKILFTEIYDVFKRFIFAVIALKTVCVPIDERYPAVPNPSIVEFKVAVVTAEFSNVVRPALVLRSWEELIYPAVPKPSIVELSCVVK